MDRVTLKHTLRTLAAVDINFPNMATLCYREFPIIQLPNENVRITFANNPNNDPSPYVVNGELQRIQMHSEREEGGNSL